MSVRRSVSPLAGFEGKESSIDIINNGTIIDEGVVASDEMILNWFFSLSVPKDFRFVLFRRSNSFFF